MPLAGFKLPLSRCTSALHTVSSGSFWDHRFGPANILKSLGGGLVVISAGIASEA